MKKLLALSSLCISISAFAGSPELDLSTPQGTIRLHHFEFIQIDKDRPCGFSVILDNLTLVGWDDIALQVEVSGGGKSAAFAVSVVTLESAGHSSAGAPCSAGQLSFPIETVKAVMSKGSPRSRDILARQIEADTQRKCAALRRATDNKRIADLTVAESRQLRNCEALR